MPEPPPGHILLAHGAQVRPGAYAAGISRRIAPGEVVEAAAGDDETVHIPGCTGTRSMNLEQLVHVAFAGARDIAQCSYWKKT